MSTPPSTPPSTNDGPVHPSNGDPNQKQQPTPAIEPAKKQEVAIKSGSSSFLWPRRSSIPHLIPGEAKLKDAIGAIDELPGDTTAIVVALQAEFEKLADWVEANGFVKPEETA